MYITVQAASGFQPPDYRVELLVAPQPLYHSVTQSTGGFGHVLITKIDIQICTIWLVDSTIVEPVVLHASLNEPVRQLCFQMPVVPEKDAPVRRATIHLSVRPDHKVTLEAGQSRILLIHYSSHFFQTDAFGKTLESLFSQRDDDQPFSLSLNAAIISVINQVIYASPVNHLAELYLEAKAKELLVLLFQSSFPEPSSSKLSEKEISILEKVKNVIQSDLSQSHNSYELSRLAAANVSKLKKNFKAFYGIPLHLFQHNCRMEKARELLLATHLSIKEISYEVGYKNVSNFSESFRNHYGYPPSKLREKGRPGNAM